MKDGKGNRVGCSVAWKSNQAYPLETVHQTCACAAGPAGRIDASPAHLQPLTCKSVTELSKLASTLAALGWYNVHILDRACDLATAQVGGAPGCTPVRDTVSLTGNMFCGLLTLLIVLESLFKRSSVALWYPKNYLVSIACSAADHLRGCAVQVVRGPW